MACSDNKNLLLLLLLICIANNLFKTSKPVPTAHIIYSNLLYLPRPEFQAESILNKIYYNSNA